MATTPPVTIIVDPEPTPVSYEAAGINRLDVLFESPMALMRRSKPRLMTDADHRARHPASNFFRFADPVGKGTWTFWTKSFARRQQ